MKSQYLRAMAPPLERTDSRGTRRLKNPRLSEHTSWETRGFCIYTVALIAYHVRTMVNASTPDRSLTPRQVRGLSRDGKPGGSSGFCPGYTQANVIVLPAKYAEDFRLLCKRNPVPCPLIGETKVGDWTIPPQLAADSDIRTSCGLYRIYEGGKLIGEVPNIKKDWADDSVAFFIGCSHSFEDALEAEGFRLRHVEQGSVVPCYRTSVPLMQAGGKSYKRQR